MAKIVVAVVAVILVVAAISLFILFGTSRTASPKTSALTDPACEQIPIDPDGNDKEQCYVEVAKETGNVGYCSSITTRTYEKDRCIFVVATKLNDSSLCDMISNIDSRELCLYNFELIDCNDVTSKSMKYICGL